MIYPIQNRDATFDFLYVSNDLHNLLERKDREVDFVESYLEDRQDGIVNFLKNMGVEYNNIISNTEVIANIPRKISIEYLQKLNHNVTEFDLLDTTEGTLYN